MPYTQKSRRKKRQLQYIEKKSIKFRKVDLSNPISDENDLFKYAKIFKDYQKTVHQECKICSRGWFDLKCDTNNVCYYCLKFKNDTSLNPFTSENLMLPGDQPPELKMLSPVEEQLIALVHPVISVYRLKSGQFGFSGNVINFAQNINTISLLLPHSIDYISNYIIVQEFEQLPNNIIIRKPKNNGYNDFIVRRDVVLNALQWLKQHNIFYKDISICENNLKKLPECDYFFKPKTTEHNPSVSKLIPESELESSLVIETGAPDILVRNNRDLVNKTIDNVLSKKKSTMIYSWPETNDKPINEFQTRGYKNILNKI